MRDFHRSGIGPMGVILCAFFTIAAFGFAGTYSGGSGTVEDPYQIQTAEQMNTIGTNPSDWGKCFKLMADIDMSIYTGSQYQIIGTRITSFTGTYDGNGHVISNLTIPGLSNYVGLFGSLGSGGQIRNLGVENVHITGNQYVGGLVGWNHSGTLTDCHVIGKVSCFDNSVGGLVGWNNEGTLTNCYAIGDIYGSHDPVGGLVGKNDRGTLTACYAAGTVRGSAESHSVGGLAGFNSGILTDCYASGTVSGSSTYQSYIGGLVGENNRGTLTACYANGSVAGSWYVGGLVGWNNAGTITSCYASGAVIGPGLSVGGLVGENSRGTLTASYATGSVSSSYGNVGGLAGWNDEGSITACFWDIQTSDQTISSGGKGLTTESMKTLSIYQNAGWADKGWVMQDGVSYPRLSWENTDGTPIPPAAVIPFAGSGTAEDPYLISSAQEFAALSWYSQVLDKQIRLTHDLDLIDLTLYPIGDLGPFTGVFDGNGHILSNGVIHQPSRGYVGLFSDVGPGGQIRNLGVENVQINGSYSVGGLAGRNFGAIADCWAIGIVSGSSGYQSFVGGLVGRNSGAINTCYAASTVSGDGEVGGLAGENSGTITSCYATGTIVGSEYIGGLIGDNSGISISCYATGTVKGFGPVGGLAGINWGGTLTACYATGAVSGSGSVGGLVGDNSGTIASCYATGIVGDSSAYSYVGGLVGGNWGPLTSCYATGAVSGSSIIGGLVGNNGGSILSCYATGSVNGSDYSVGGLVGQHEYSGTITACYATGSVNGSGWDVGGLVGYQSSGTIMNSYATGTISGSERVGGLAGMNDSGTITACFATGSVSGSPSSKYVGGLVGYHWLGAMTTSFWDVQTSGITSSSGGTGLTTAEMKKLATFADAGWDFEHVWEIGQGQTYPYLRQAPAGDLNHDGRIDLADFAIFASHWMEGM